MRLDNIWTPRELRILRKQYPIIADTKKLADLLGRSRKSVSSKAKVLGIKREVPHPGKSTALPEEDKFIKKNYLKLPINTIAKILSNTIQPRSKTFVNTRMARMNLIRPRKLIEKFKRDSRIKPGNVPPNKGKKQKDYMSKEAIKRTKATRFKKGQIPHNAIGFKDGDITIRHDHPNRKNTKPHKYIRLALGVWKELQIVNWEKKHGPIPKGFILACKDGDTLNCKTSNWYLMSMADNVRRNSGSLNLADGYVAKTIVGKYSDPELLEEIKKNKTLIELKRSQLLLNRKIKQKLS